MPGIRERRCALDHFPGDPVDVGKNEAGAWRPDQESLPADHIHGLDPDQADSASAVRLVVSGLEVDGHEYPVGRRERGGPGWAAFGHDLFVKYQDVPPSRSDWTAER